MPPTPQIEFIPATDPPTANKIPAYHILGMPGLCVHQHHFPSILSDEDRDMWAIAHIKSGKSVIQLYWYRKEDAIDFANIYLVGIDWNVSADDIANDESIAKVIAESRHDVLMGDLLRRTFNRGNGPDAYNPAN